MQTGTWQSAVRGSTVGPSKGVKYMEKSKTSFFPVRLVPFAEESRHF